MKIAREIITINHPEKKDIGVQGGGGNFQDKLKRSLRRGHWS